MPEEQAADLIGGRLHIEGHADALLFPCDTVLHLQYNGGGKILIPPVGYLIILADIDHTPQILDEASIRIVRRRLVKEAPAVCVGIKDDLHGVNDRGLSASGMSREKVDAFVQMQHLPVDIMPVIQSDSGKYFISLCLLFHLPTPLPFPQMSVSVPGRPPA